MPRPRVKPTGARIGGLPTYTKEQFAQIRPNGKYSNYLAYIKRARGITGGPSTPPYPGRGGPGLPNYMTLLRQMQGSFQTPKQMEAQANRMAQQQIAAQRAIIADEYKRSQDDAMRRMLAFQAAGREAAAMNSSLIGMVGRGYTQGADALNAMASGAASQAALATQGSVAAADAAASNVGMPGVTVGGPVGAPGLAGDTQAGVESYYGGVLPGQALTNAGGFASAGMAGQIASQNLRATQEAQAAYMQAMGEAGTTRSDAMREMLRARPGLVSDYLLKLQDAQRQNTALAMSVMEARRNALNQGFGQKMTKQENTRQNQAAKDAHKAAVQAAKLQKRQIDEARSVALGYYVDNMGRPVTYQTGKKKGQPIPVPATVKNSGTATPTAREIREKAAAAADQWVYRHRDRRGNLIGNPDQLKRYLKALYPGIQKDVINAIASSYFEKQKPGNTGKSDPFAK